MNRQDKAEIYSSTLYVVPTPIGNLDDITQRALFVLQGVDLIAAEDTRHTGILLQYFSINNRRLFTLCNNNEKQKVNILLAKLKYGHSVALVSNAGTPLINDPGYNLVRRCRELDIRVVPLPGACAAITALSASGLPSNRFCYEGFLPTKRKARLDYLQELNQESRTMIFYESTHRIINSLEDMVTVWGPMRYIVLAREITKAWETLYGDNIADLLSWVKKDKKRIRGEIVILVKGYNQSNNLMPPKVLRTLSILLNEFPLKKAAALTAEIYGVKKNALYRYAINR